jgi:hypothetical protein
MSAVCAALAADPVLASNYADFRDKTEAALDPALVALVRQAVASVHRMGEAPDEGGLDDGTRTVLAYACRMPFEHTAITDGEAAALVLHLGEAGFVAFSVLAALADAECRAELVGLAELAGG